MDGRKYRRILEGRKAADPVASPGEQDIVTAAIEIFGHKGYAASGLREIADRARVTAPLISYHFGSKEGLYARCVDVVLGALAECAMEAVEEDRGIVDAVRRYARAHVDFSLDHPEALRFALSMAYGPAAGQPEVDWTPHYSRMFAWASQRFDRAIREGEFHLRPDTNLSLVLRHLFHIVHLEVFSAYERVRFAEQIEVFEKSDAHAACGQLEAGEAVEDVVRQFFLGAGQVADMSSFDGTSN